MKNYCIIPDNQQNFLALVQELPVEEGEKEALACAAVQKVYVDVTQKTWTVHMAAPCSLSQQTIDLIGDTLRKNCGLA